MNIKDIAKLANVSTATVSRVINNKHQGNVSTATYNRIMRLLKETNYVPNAIASSLRTGLAKSIGIVFPDNVNPYYAQLGSAIENICFEAGYTALLCNTKQDADREKKYVKLLSNQHVAGIILCSTGLTCDEIKENLAFKETKVILVDELIEGFKGPVVIGDDIHGGYLGTEYLFKLGHKNIVAITGPMNLSSAKDRLNGMLKCADEYKIKIPKSRIIHGDYSMESAYQHISRIIKNQKINFSAIFAFSDLMAFGALKALEDNHIKVPEEMSILGYDDIFFDTITRPALTTVATPIRDMGIASFQQIINPPTEENHEKKIILKPNLVIRESCQELM